MDTAPSILTLVRVLRLLNIMAIVLPLKTPRIDLGIEPDLIACLCEWALRTRVVSSVEERSPMDRRDRGAKGDVGRVVVEEKRRFWDWRQSFNARDGGIVPRMEMVHSARLLTIFNNVDVIHHTECRRGCGRITRVTRVTVA